MDGTLTDYTLIRALVFAVAAIGGTLFLVYMGYRQWRSAAGPSPDVTRGRDTRAFPLDRGVDPVRDTPAEWLRDLATAWDAAVDRDLDAARDAARRGDAEIAALLRERASFEEEWADRALDLLRARGGESRGAPRP